MKCCGSLIYTCWLQGFQQQNASRALDYESFPSWLVSAGAEYDENIYYVSHCDRIPWNPLECQLIFTKYRMKSITALYATHGRAASLAVRRCVWGFNASSGKCECLKEAGFRVLQTDSMLLFPLNSIGRPTAMMIDYDFVYLALRDICTKSITFTLDLINIWSLNVAVSV